MPDKKPPTWRGVEIKPCPFKKCGEKYDLKVAQSFDYPDRWVHCWKCYAHGPYAPTGIAAVRAWNEVERRKG